MRQSYNRALQTKLGRLMFERGGALALVVLVVYIWLAPTTIVDGDNAEFSTMGAIGGRAHPSGYPAYVLYLRLTSWIPGASPAHTAAIATSILAALLVFVLHAACRAWGARPLAATLACALYAASPVVLRMHVEAEVFAMNGLVVATVVWLAAQTGPARGVLRCALLGLVAGLGLANHLTCSLVAPVGILGVVRGIREVSGRPHKLVAGAAAAAGLGVGLLPYLYLFVADGPASYGNVDTFADLRDFILREDYGGFGSFIPTGVEVSVATNLGSLAATLGRGLLWVPPVAAVVMLGVRIARPKGETRWAWAMLAASFLVAGPLLVTRFNIEPQGLGLYVIQRFHLLPILLLVIPMAIAADRVGPLIRVTLAPAIGHALVVAGFVILTVTALPRLRAVHSPAMERQVHYMLASLPPNAVVFSGTEDICFGADYLQHTLGERPDVVVMCWILTSRQWFRDRVVAAGVPIVGGFTIQPTIAQAEAVLAKRPLFADRSFGLVADLPSYPYGILMRLSKRGEPLPPLVEILDQNQKLFRSFDLDYPHPGVDDDFASTAHKRYAATWIVLAKALEAAGDKAGALAAAELALSLYPSKDVD